MERDDDHEHAVDMAVNEAIQMACGSDSPQVVLGYVLVAHVSDAEAGDYVVNWHTQGQTSFQSLGLLEASAVTRRMDVEFKHGKRFGYIDDD